MFKSARIKLTAWYLLIISVISIFFSGIIFLNLSQELERGFNRAEMRLMAEQLGIPLPPGAMLKPEDLPLKLRERLKESVLTKELTEAKRQLGISILAVNGVILIFSAGASWILAGKALKPLEQAMEEQKRFVADASHELRTPLTALKTEIEVGLREKEPNLKEVKRLLKSNLEEIEGLQALTDNLLYLARHQERGNHFNFKALDLALIAKKAVAKIKPLAKKKEIAIKTKIQKAPVFGEEGELEKLMVIFLDNAIKYTPRKGQIDLQTGAEKKKIIVEIQDTGVGIPEKDLPHIFDRFYRVDQARAKDKTNGFGLGLSLAKRIIEMHRGTVRVTSEPGKGTTFKVEFPVKSA